MALKKHIFGFSLIELMIVVSIIGILAAISLPTYQQYVARARFTEIIAQTAPYKTAVLLALQEGISLDELNNERHGIPAHPKATKNLADIDVNQGVITAKATAALDETEYILTYQQEDQTWLTSGTCLEKGWCHE